MTPRGWLDVHGHFYLPSSDDEANKLGDAFRSVSFMVQGPVCWSAEEVLAYNDKAAVDMQMLSYIPQDHDELREANTFGNQLVRQHPHRFGLLGALPTDDAGACLAEIKRLDTFDPKPDGYALTTVYNGVGLGDERLEPLWTELNARRAVVHIHPNAYAPANLGRPAPLVEVAFDTCRTVLDMLYKGVFRRHVKIRFVLGHCGGALPALSSRLALLGAEDWIPNPEGISRAEIEQQLGSLFVDTAATAKTGLGPALKMVGMANCIYGSDCGVPCSNEKTMEENKSDIVELEKEYKLPAGQIATNGWVLFPDAAVRAGKFGEAKETPML